MTWRSGLAVAILALWAIAVLVSVGRHRPEDRDLVNAMTPVALAAATFLFAEPVITERVQARRRRNGNHNGDPVGP